MAILTHQKITVWYKNDILSRSFMGKLEVYFVSVTSLHEGLCLDLSLLLRVKLEIFIVFFCFCHTLKKPFEFEYR
jgi:hypothetical protein